MMHLNIVVLKCFSSIILHAVSNNGLGRSAYISGFAFFRVSEDSVELQIVFFSSSIHFSHSQSLSKDGVDRS